MHHTSVEDNRLTACVYWGRLGLLLEICNGTRVIISQNLGWCAMTWTHYSC